jgi:hypothetical protein
MKILASIILAAGLVSAALAAEPTVEIKDTGNAFIDGSNAGQPADVIANRPTLAPAINKALVAYVAKVKADAEASIKTAQDAATKAIADAATAKDAAIASTLAAKDQEIAALKARIAELKPPSS